MAKTRTPGKKILNPPPIDRGCPQVILIHGTFAREADWTRPDGLLTTKIIDTFGAGTSVHRFAWSGANTHRLRFDAGAELTQVAERLAIESPARPLIFIGHSHGGNIALSALTESALLRQHVAAAVCLNTPFLVYRPRSAFLELFKEPLEMSFGTLLVIVVLAGWAMGCLVASSPFDPGLFGALAGVTGGAVGGAIALGMAVGMWSVLQTAADALADYSVWAAKMLRYDTKGVFVHIFTVSLDEARWWLQAWDITTAAVRDGPIMLANSMLLVSSIVCVAALPLSIFFSGDEPRVVAAAVMATVVGFAAPLVGIGVGLLTAALSSTWRALPVTYGEQFMMTMAASVRASRTPDLEGTFSEKRVKLQGRSEGLRHSRLYNEPEVASDVVTLLTADLMTWKVRPMLAPTASFRKDRSVTSPSAPLKRSQRAALLLIHLGGYALIAVLIYIAAFILIDSFYG